MLQLNQVCYTCMFLVRLLLACVSSTQHFPFALGLDGDWEKARGWVFILSVSLELVNTAPFYPLIWLLC